MSSTEPEVSLEAKIRFLEHADAYAERPARVEHVETHFAHVFLTERFAYKLKKPIRFHAVDFTTLEARRATCASEVELNRRLAERVYIGAVPLSARARRLALESEHGTVVDWLVKMHRLPRERMLDARLARGGVGDDELHALVAKLAEFYSRAPRAPWNGAEHGRRLERTLRLAGNDLTARAHELDDTSSARVVSGQLELLERHAAALEARCESGRVVDAHGDLRPEHVLLAGEPQIIDCLEFSDELRMLDTGEEIAFLALECAMLGAPEPAARIVELYRTLCDDALAQPLLELFYSQRALARARSCAWHLDEPLSDDMRAHWIARAKRYLEAAALAVERARL